jgi:hypothetical protein
MDEKNESTARRTVPKPGDLDENGRMPSPFAIRAVSVDNQEDLPAEKRNACCLFDGDSLADLFKNQTRKLK